METLREGQDLNNNNFFKSTCSPSHSNSNISTREQKNKEFSEQTTVEKPGFLCRKVQFSLSVD